jgi:hypothetical protein
LQKLSINDDKELKSIESEHLAVDITKKAAKVHIPERVSKSDWREQQQTANVSKQPDQQHKFLIPLEADRLIKPQPRRLNNQSHLSPPPLTNKNNVSRIISPKLINTTDHHIECIFTD